MLHSSKQELNSQMYRFVCFASAFAATLWRYFDTERIWPQGFRSLNPILQTFLWLFGHFVSCSTLYLQVKLCHRSNVAPIKISLKNANEITNCFAQPSCQCWAQSDIIYHEGRSATHEWNKQVPRRQWTHFAAGPHSALTAYIFASPLKSVDTSQFGALIYGVTCGDLHLVSAATAT